MSLIFDIETASENFDELDEATQESLTRWIKRESKSEAEYKIALEDLKNGLGFSPLTGRIVAIGILDSDKDQGVVYYDPGKGEAEELVEKNCKLKPMSEKEMLQNFWQGAKSYNEFVSFNGRSFDVPFLMVRSAVYSIRPSKNLMEGRYLYQQRSCKHIDLLDQLSFYGALQRKGSLHLWTRVFGIESPKVGEVSGEDVGRLYDEGKTIEVARYNVGDLIATKELYDRWQKYLSYE